jgi:hypothetical protein
MSRWQTKARHSMAVAAKKPRPNSRKQSKQQDDAPRNDRRLRFYFSHTDPSRLPTRARRFWMRIHRALDEQGNALRCWYVDGIITNAGFLQGEYSRYVRRMSNGRRQTPCIIVDPRALTLALDTVPGESPLSTRFGLSVSTWGRSRVTGAFARRCLAHLAVPNMGDDEQDLETFRRIIEDVSAVAFDAQFHEESVVRAAQDLGGAATAEVREERERRARQTDTAMRRDRFRHQVPDEDFIAGWRDGDGVSSAWAASRVMFLSVMQGHTTPRRLAELIEIADPPPQVSEQAIVARLVALGCPDAEESRPRLPVRWFFKPEGAVFWRWVEGEITRQRLATARRLRVFRRYARR